MHNEISGRFCKFIVFCNEQILTALTTYPLSIKHIISALIGYDKKTEHQCDPQYIHEADKGLEINSLLT